MFTLCVSPLSLCNLLSLEIRPSSRNKYSCHLSTEDSAILSNYFLQAAAFVERGAGGFTQGIFWKSAFASTRRVSSGWYVRVATEQRTVQVELISAASRHYGVSVEPDQALEAACQLWVHSTGQESK